MGSASATKPCTRSLRARGVRVPALVVTALTDLELVSQATAAGAMFAPKPFLLEHLEAFVDDVRAKRLPRTKLRAVVERLAAAHHLSDREEDLVFHAAAGLRELHLERRLGVRHTTLRGMFHNVIARTGDRTFADVITRVHAEVFAPEAPLPWHADRPRARSRA
jgi:FixJ family two-component response regulator